MENLSREELLEKSTKLLGILKKQKLSHDELVEEKKAFQQEIDSLKEEVKSLQDTCSTQQEIVTDLTDHKVSYITKNESLQRQLQLLTTELESVKNSEEELIKANQNLEEDLKKYGLIISKQKHVIDQLQAKEAKELDRLNQERSDFEVHINELTSKLKETEDYQTQLKEISDEKYSMEVELQSLKKVQEKFNDMEKKLILVANEKKACDIICDELRQENMKLKDAQKAELTVVEKISTSNELTQTDVSLDEETVKQLINTISGIYKIDIGNGNIQENLEMVVSHLDKKKLLVSTISAQLNDIPTLFVTFLNELIHVLKSREYDIDFSNIYNNTYFMSLNEYFNISRDVSNEEEIDYKYVELREAIKDFIEKYESIDKTQQESTVKCNKMEAEMELLSQNLMNMETKSCQLEKDCILLTEQLKTAVESNENNVREHKNIEEMLKNQISENLSVSSLLEKELDELKEKYQQLESTENYEKSEEYLTLKSEMNEHKGNAEMLADEKLEMQQEFDKKIAYCSSLEKEMDILKDELLEKSKHLENNSSLQKLMESESEKHLNTIEQLQVENTKLTQDIELGKQTVQSLETETQNMKLELSQKSDSEEQYKTWMQEQDLLKEENSRIKNDLEEYAKNNAKLESEIDETTSNLSAVNLDYENLKTKHEEMVCENNKLLSEIENNQLKYQEICELNTDLTDKLQRLEAMENEWKNTQETMESIKSELSTKTELHEELQIEYKNISEKVTSQNLCLSKTQQDLEKVNHEKMSLENTISHLNDQISNIKTQLTGKETECKEMTSKLEDCIVQHEAQLEEMKTTSKLNDNELIEELRKEISTMNSIIEEKKKEILQYKDTINNIQDKYNELENGHTSLQNKIDQLNKDYDNLTQEKEVLLTKFRTLIRHNKMTEQCYEEFSLAQDVADMALETFENLLKESMDTCDTSEISKEEIESFLKKLPLRLQGHVKKEEELNQRCENLLQDNNELNQVLKERGERISRLETSLSEKNSELQSVTSEMAVLRSEIISSVKEASPNAATSHDNYDFSQKLQTLVMENKSMKEEISRLEASISRTDHHNRSAHDAQSEVMSTSTISKAEDGERMKELEDTFEEKYMKLKSIALRLKRQLAETKLELRNNEEAKQKLQRQNEELQKRANGFHLKNIQALQDEIDRCQDQLESKTKELKVIENQLLSVAEQLSQYKSKVVLLQEEKDSVLEILNVMKQSNADLEKQQEKLKKDLTSMEADLKVRDMNIESLQKEIKSMQLKESSERQEKENALKLVEESKQSSKKYSLMDLEMLDYEKRFENLSSELKEKDQIIGMLEMDLKSSKENENTFLEQITFLKDQVETELQRAEGLKTSCSDLRDQLFKAQENEDKMRWEKEAAINSLEDMKQDLENQKLSLAKLTNASSKTESTLLNEKQMAQRLAENLSDKINKYESRITELELDLASVNKEFEGYKVRAQSVLKTKPKISEDLHIQLQQEKESLESELKTVHETLQQIRCELSASNAEVRFLNSEKVRLLEEIKQMNTDYEKSRKEFQNEVKQLIKTQEHIKKEHQETINKMDIHTETIVNNYKTQLSSKDDFYKNEIEGLERELCEIHEKSARVVNPSQSKMDIKTSEVHHQDSSDIANMIREDGEGSEWVEPAHPQSNYNPPTLDQLINAPLPPLLNQEDSSSIISGHTESSRDNLLRLEEKNGALEKRVSHISCLLSESESENAKLLQLCETLKEELRKISRNESREKHLENNEYLKNIVLKFVHLKTGDEKSRLVPVLRTLLQLSPQESTELTKLASGSDPATSYSSQGWGDYLHLWSGR